jgi:hypothetical protein
VKVTIQVASDFTEWAFLVKTENCTFDYSFKHITDSLSAQSRKIYFSQPELNKWTKVSYQRGRSTQEESEREAKHAKEGEHWLNQTSTSNHYTALLEEEWKTNSRKPVLRARPNLQTI